jgi:signal transduction histidine kinase
VNEMMISTESMVSILILSLKNTQRPLSQDMMDYLAYANYQPMMIDSIDEAWNVLQLSPPDVVLAVENPADNLRFFKIIKESLDAPHCPALILLTNDPVHERYDDFADAILPPIPHCVDHQLRRTLQLRAEYVHKEAEIQQLNGEIRNLKNELELHKKSIDEVALLKSAIVRNVSHELRTPLLQVKSAVALLAEDIGNTNLAEYALGATARLETVVRNITQLANSLDEMSIVPIIMREAIESAARNLRRTWEHKDAIARIQINIAENLPLAMGDRYGISTVLHLLLDNALKFSDGPVQVKMYHNDGKIHIAVSDHGIGIAQDKIQTIFETFYQIDSSSTRRYGGVGVGLAIVQLILERHNAPIRVDSIEGHGSTFSFSLPVAELN